MVVDSSALTAMIVGEGERDIFEDLILRAPTAVMSVAAVLETSIVLRNKRRDADADWPIFAWMSVPSMSRKGAWRATPSPHTAEGGTPPG